jgi:hypothetical protein
MTIKTIDLTTLVSSLWRLAYLELFFAVIDIFEMLKKSSPALAAHEVPSAAMRVLNLRNMILRVL